MTFEEFFKKKKINLTTLQQAEGALFAEFKDHFELMGEKSFDHTKKYWFNKLRRQFPAPEEVKTEKVIMENPLAEQTITETLTEQIVEKHKTGFTPRFKAGATAANITDSTPPATDETKTGDEDKNAITTKPGFTPRFKAGVTPKPQEPTTSEAEGQKTAEEPTKPAATTKPGFTPRFKAGVTSAPKQETSAEPKAEEEKTEQPATPAQPAKVGFTPRFKAGVTATKPAEPTPDPQQETEKSEEPTEQPAKPKIGFTPRFKAGITSTKPAEPIEEVKPKEESPKPDTGADQPDQPANPTLKWALSQDSNHHNNSFYSTTATPFCHSDDRKNLLRLIVLYSLCSYEIPFLEQVQAVVSLN